jgi:hypothetical protein
MNSLEILGAAELTYLFGILTALSAMRLKPRRKRKKANEATVVGNTLLQRKKKPVRKVATDPFPPPPLPTLPPMRKVQ